MIDGYLWIEYDRLKNFHCPESWDESDYNSLLKAIIAFCDRESPLSEIRDIPKRWKRVYKDFGIKAGSAAHSEISSLGKLFNGTMFNYFLLLNDSDYEMWLSMKIHFHSLTMELRRLYFDERSLAIRATISKSLPDLKKEIQSLEAKIFKDQYLQRIITEEAVQDLLGGYAEQFAELPPYMKNLN